MKKNPSYISKDPRRLILLNTDTFEVNEYCKYMLESEMKITKLSIISFIENLLSFHSDNLDTKIKLISSEFPNTEKVIKDSPEIRKNNKIYWQNSECQITVGGQV